MIITRTPFRISFFGGGTDYPTWYEKNGGAVLSTSIDKYCYITCRKLPPFFNHKSRVVWSKIEVVKNHDEIQHPAVRGALKFLKIDNGLEIHHNGDLPARSGLGSSSSFSVGLLHALYALRGQMKTKKQLALDAIHLEQNILKENVGSQDQVAAAFGGLNKIEFSGAHKINVNPISLSPEKLNSLQDHFIFFFTGITRIASNIAAEQIRKTKDRSQELNKMRKMVEEGLHILRSNTSLDDFGKLLNETWQIKRSLTSKISNPQIDELYDTGIKAGALGGKLIGAGGGGFIIFFARPENQPKIKEKLNKLLQVPFKFENEGSQIIYYGPEIES